MDRRLTAAVLAAVLLTAAACQEDPTSAPARPPIPIWPESPLTDETPAAAQERPDDWRFEPARVVDRFARSVLGWGTPVIEETAPGSYFLSPGHSETPLRVGVVQPVAQGAGGIWSVGSVAHPDLTVSVGNERVVFDLNLPEGRVAHVGIRAANGCGEISAYEVGVRAGRTVVEIPPRDPGCAEPATGYAFAYVTDAATVPTGDPLLEAATIDEPWLTVIPVSLAS